MVGLAPRVDVLRWAAVRLHDGGHLFLRVLVRAQALHEPLDCQGRLVQAKAGWQRPRHARLRHERHRRRSAGRGAAVAGHVGGVGRGLVGGVGRGLVGERSRGPLGRVGGGGTLTQESLEPHEPLIPHRLRCAVATLTLEGFLGGTGRLELAEKEGGARQEHQPFGRRARGAVLAHPVGVPKDRAVGVQQGREPIADLGVATAVLRRGYVLRLAAHDVEQFDRRLSGRLARQRVGAQGVAEVGRRVRGVGLGLLRPRLA